LDEDYVEERIRKDIFPRNYYVKTCILISLWCVWMIPAHKLFRERYYIRNHPIWIWV